jgi:protein-disulfide isomerase
MGLFNRRAVFGIAAAAVAALALAACGPKSAGEPSSEDMTLGETDAKVTIIEYGSLSCHHCADWNKEVFPQFKTKYIDTGRVHYIFRPFQLGPQDTYTSAGDLLGRCLGKDKYFPAIDALFHAQEEALSGGARDALLQVAGSAGMSEDQVRACLNDDKAVAAQADRFTAGWAKQVEATPTFFINGKKYGEKLLMPALDAAIAEAEAGKK